MDTEGRVTQQLTKPHFRGEPVDLVVDVRTKIEYWTGHLPGAVCIPVERLPGGITGRAGVTTSSRILVYCAGGVRSAAAAAKLRDAGFHDVVDAGGYADAMNHFAP
jgi:phage shock protein E